MQRMSYSTETVLSNKIDRSSTELAKKVCPRLRDSSSGRGASSHNLGHTFLAISVYVVLSFKDSPRKPSRRRPSALTGETFCWLFLVSFFRIQILQSCVLSTRVSSHLALPYIFVGQSKHFWTLHAAHSHTHDNTPKYSVVRSLRGFAISALKSLRGNLSLPCTIFRPQLMFSCTKCSSAQNESCSYTQLRNALWKNYLFHLSLNFWLARKVEWLLSVCLRKRRGLREERRGKQELLLQWASSNSWLVGWVSQFPLLLNDVTDTAGVKSLLHATVVIS